jgi:hypothetical protein
MLERISSSLAREWLRITRVLLIVKGPEPAPRSLNKLTSMNGAKRHKVFRASLGSKRQTKILSHDDLAHLMLTRHAKYAKPNPLTK